MTKKEVFLLTAKRTHPDRINVYLKSELAKQVRDLAKDEHRSDSQMVTVLISEALKAREAKQAELAEALSR